MHLVRQTAEGLADLVGQHLKLARLELTGDLLAAVRRARVLLVLVLLAVVGYALTMAGIAVAVGGHQRVGVALLAVGVIHLGLAGVSMLLATRKRSPLMDASVDEAKQSLESLSAASLPDGREATVAPPS
jgi:hypothetical protein